MDWDALAAIGEIIGAIAVVGSLLYLASQMRQHTRALHSSSFQATTEALNQINLTIATDPDLLRVVSLRPERLDQLSEADRFRYSYVLLSLFRVRETIYYQAMQGATAQQSWIREELTLRDNLRTGGVREWWKTVTYGFTPEFSAFVDGVVAEMERTGEPPTGESS